MELGCPKTPFFGQILCPVFGPGHITLECPRLLGFGLGHGGPKSGQGRWAVLDGLGWNPILAKNGLEALEIIQRAAYLPDLILLDVEMPQMDGYELTSTLRANTEYQNLPIVMLTSRSGDKHRQKAFEVGATEYVIKPYRDAILVDLVRRLITQSRGTSAEWQTS